MPIKVIQLSLEQNLATTYCLANESKQCILFDLGYNKNDYIENYLAKHEYTCLGLFLTHGHYDHILGINKLSLPQKFPIYIYEDDYRCLEDPKYSLTSYLDNIEIIKQGIKVDCLKEGEIKVGDFEFEVIATPFHTLGSVCYYFKKDKILISGDSLFKLSIGRMDLPGNAKEMLDSSLNKIRQLDKECIVYPGHGPITKLENELKFNPYLRK